MSWKGCLEEFSAIKITPDKQKATSLIETADARIKFIKKQKIDEKNCSFVLEAYYSSVVEYLHAILLAKGYKVKNHICLGYYIQEILKRDDLYRIFDINRKRRNAIVYYGQLIKLKTGKKAVEDVKKLIMNLKIYLTRGEKNAYKSASADTGAD